MRFNTCPSKAILHSPFYWVLDPKEETIPTTVTLFGALRSHVIHSKGRWSVSLLSLGQSTAYLLRRWLPWEMETAQSYQDSCTAQSSLGDREFVILPLRPKERKFLLSIRHLFLAIVLDLCSLAVSVLELNAKSLLFDKSGIWMCGVKLFLTCNL